MTGVQTCALPISGIVLGRVPHEPRVIPEGILVGERPRLADGVAHPEPALVEHVAGLQAAHKIGNGINKPLLVGAVDDPLLLEAGAARKRGFSFPMDRWMRDSAHELEDMAVSGDVLNRTAVQALWKQFRGGQLHWSRAWALSVLGSTVH